jgi:hypothetical protein
MKSHERLVAGRRAIASALSAIELKSAMESASSKLSSAVEAVSPDIAAPGLRVVSRLRHIARLYVKREAAVTADNCWHGHAA